MARWRPGARERLEQAALELFVDQGFADTTVPQIAARAGLTTRTFFRHFADKREVLFAGDGELPALVAQLWADTPADLPPVAAIRHGLTTVARTRFEYNYDYLRTRRAVVQADDSLRERELRKRSILADAIHHGFTSRGVDEPTAALAAGIAVTVLGVALNRWLDSEDDLPLADHIHHAVDAIGQLWVPDRLVAAKTWSQNLAACRCSWLKRL